jgi:oligopeptide transport system substrate-binding protein
MPSPHSASSGWSPRLLLALSVACLGLCGCRQKSTQVERSGKLQILEIGNLTEPSSIDPSLVYFSTEAAIVYALDEGLLSYDPTDLHPVPGVAERWETNADATSWTFHLRKEAVWTNGDPVTARDFVYAYRRTLTPKLGSSSSYILFRLKNAEAYYTGKIADFGQVGAHAVDDHTLVLDLRTPIPYFASMVCAANWFPIHQAAVEKFGAMDDSSTPWTRPGNFVGNGAFILTEWTPNKVIRAVKSRTYWNRDAVRLQGCNFYPIDDKAAEELAFRSGLVHVTQLVPIDKIAGYRADPSGVLREFYTAATFMVRFNVNKPPLNDVRVRRALALSIDREGIVKHLLKGGETVANSLAPPGIGGFTARSSMTTDVSEAQRLLAAAGYPGGKGFPKLEYLYAYTGGAKSALGETLQEMWRKNLGIEVALTSQEYRVWNDSLQKGDYQISYNNWIADYLDPSTFIDLMVTNGGNNQTGWSSPEYDRLDGLAAATADNTVRFECFQKCEDILGRECPIVPLFIDTGNRLVRPEVKGWYDNPLDVHPLNGVHLEP